MILYKKSRLLPIFVLMVVISLPALTQRSLDVVPSVNLERYCGVWYEIARLPNSFQEKCAGSVTATYTLLDNGQIKVVNLCQKENGEIVEAEGRAKVASKDEPNTKLKVRFAPAILSFLPFVWGNYWILELDSAYTYAVIGEPKREYLWILSRTPRIDEEIFQNLLNKVKEKGYDVSEIIRTKQTE